MLSRARECAAGQLWRVLTGYFMNLGNNPGIFSSGAYAMNELVRPASVILTHPNEPVTEGGKLRPASRTAALMKELKPAAYLALSGRTMEFDGQGKCVAGC